MPPKYLIRVSFLLHATETVLWVRESSPVVAGKSSPLFKGGWDLRSVKFSMGMSIKKWGILFLQGNSFPQANSLLVNPDKTVTFVLVVKYITCNTKVGEIISFCDFFLKKKTMQAAVICTKKHQLPVVILEIEGSVPAALIELPLYS